MATSRTQVDQLGERLRAGDPTEKDLRELDAYRRSFAPGYEEVFRRIRTELKIEPSGRAEKTTQSIINKLQRESIRLSQMQDIAGCRIVLSGTAE